MDRWASYYDLLEVDQKVLDKTLEAAGIYCFDAVNLTFEYSSSTSGMYPKWYVGISMNCTINDLRVRAPMGVGGHINEALEDLTKKLYKLANEHESLRAAAKMKGITLPEKV